MRSIDGSWVMFDEILAHKFNDAGVQVAQSILLPYSSGYSYMSFSDDTVFVVMTTDIAVSGSGFEDEVLNSDGDEAVRVAALRLDDLSIKWTQLIQSNDQYGQDSIAAGVALADDILYVGVSTSGELYYDSSLLTTPAATANLVALHAGDGSELDHKSWITDPNFDPEYNNGLLNLIKHMSMGPNNSLFFTGWIKLNFNQTSYFSASSIESYVLKTQLPVSAAILPTEPLGLSRNAYTEIVTDHEHNLQWDDRYSTNNSTAYWSSANSACTSMVDLLGDGGWRLPTDLEIERTGYIPVVGSVFERIDPFGSDDPDFIIDPAAVYYYWSSTEGLDDTWHVAIDFLGEGDSFLNDTSHNYRCVRDMN
jgi:hypothetical protein